MKQYLSCPLLLLAISLIAVSCSSHYELSNLVRTRILVDNTFDATKDAEAMAFMEQYRSKVDSVMQPVIGQTAHYMYADAPESPLSNLLPDILMWTGERYNETPEFAIYNIGGMRAALAEGDVTIGDIFALAPFENKICFLTLKGSDVRQLFEEIALQKGQGVSREVKLKISHSGKLNEALISGWPIDENKDYRIVTIDYVAQGNDRMAAFKKKTDVHQPDGENDNVRYVIIDYFKSKMEKGEKVNQQIEGRIIIE